MNSYPKRRCANCREVIEFEHGEVNEWVHVKGTKVETNHSITPLKLSEYTEEERQSK